MENKFLLAFIFVGIVGTVSAQLDARVAGTYELLICKSDCGFTSDQSVIARGVVVLFNRSLSADEIKNVGTMPFASAPEDLRACFSGDRPEHAETYAFIQEKAAIAWSIENDVLKLELFRSPDAGYNAELRAQGDVLTGAGTSWGAGAGSPNFAKDNVIVGRRVGPPDISRCLVDAR